jgi:hypothetical protein
MSGQIVGKRWIIGKHKLDNARAVTALKPLHELRQEFVSQLCAKYGIYAASRMLRHADRASAVEGAHAEDHSRPSGSASEIRNAETKFGESRDSVFR